MIRVLIIEDDLMLAEIHKQFVDQVDGYEVVAVANDGKKALELLRTIDLDLIILDVYMPLMDGFELLEAVRNDGIQVDTILVTAAKRADQLDYALKLGAIDYLVKPFEFKRLKASLNQYKQRKKLISTHDVIQQKDIDTLLKRNATPIEVPQLPKGLNKLTLQRIEKFIVKNKGKTFKSDEIATQLDLSKVSIRKYFEYLQSIGKVTIITDYGTRGRPSYLYKVL